MQDSVSKLNGKVSLALAMVIYGSIGLFRRSIDLPSSLIAVVRGILGAVSLLLLLRMKKEKLDIDSVKKAAGPLVLSGLFIGINWILLFEAYNYTTVAAATICYYLAPVIVTVLAPFVLSEKLTLKKGICVLVALLGAALVSGITEAGFTGGTEYKGVLLGTGAACFYAMVILINKKYLGEVGAYETTVPQLLCAGVLMIPYVILREPLSGLRPDLVSVLLLLVVSFIHTGLAYYLYFGSVKTISAQTVAIFSYIDPVVAILLSAFLLREPMTMTAVIGAVLVLGATIISERTT